MRHPSLPDLPTRTSRRLGAGLAAAALALTSLTACSSAVGEQSGGGAQGGGVLEIGATNDLVPATFFTNSSDSTNVVVGNVYDSLVDYPADSLEPQPSLATSWELADDGLSLTLQLRDDVRFHDGRPFTSEDVAFSIRTWADPAWAVQLQRTAAAVTDIDTSDPHEVTLGFEHPLSNVFDLLDMVPIIDEESFDQLADGEAYVGTGPFVFESWTPSSEIVLSRNDDYWAEEPELEGIDISIVGDPQSQVSQLRSGQLDLITGASSRDLSSLESGGDADVTSFTGAERNVYVGADLLNPQLEDPRLRKAIAFALDRDRILDEVYQGAGFAASLPWPEYSPAYDEQANATYFRDLDRARSLVDEVGDVGTVPLAYPAGVANYEATAQIVQADLEEVGIRTELQPLEFTDFIDKLIAGDFGGLWILEHLYAQYTPSTLAVSAYPFNADKNASHFEDADYKEHADAAWRLRDGTDQEAVDLYSRLSQDLLDNAFLLEIAVLTPRIASRGVEGLAWSKRAELDLTEASLGDAS